MAQLGANALGEMLEPGRVPDCYLGLRLDPTDHDAEAAGVLVVAPAALLHPVVPQPDGTVLYELLTGHPDRTPHESDPDGSRRIVWMINGMINRPGRQSTGGTPTRSPGRSSAAGRTARSAGSRSTTSAWRRPARSPARP